MDQNFILKLPPRLADEVEEAIDSERFERIRIYRAADQFMKFVFDEIEYDAIFYNLPNVIEAHKSLDMKQFYKSADVSNCLYVFDNGRPFLPIQKPVVKKAQRVTFSDKIHESILDVANTELSDGWVGSEALSNDQDEKNTIFDLKRNEFFQKKNSPTFSFETNDSLNENKSIRSKKKAPSSPTAKPAYRKASRSVHKSRKSKVTRPHESFVHSFFEKVRIRLRPEDFEAIFSLHKPGCSESNNSYSVELTFKIPKDPKSNELDKLETEHSPSNENLKISPNNTENDKNLEISDNPIEPKQSVTDCLKNDKMLQTLDDKISSEFSKKNKSSESTTSEILSVHFDSLLNVSPKSVSKISELNSQEIGAKNRDFFALNQKTVNIDSDSTKEKLISESNLHSDRTATDFNTTPRQKRLCSVFGPDHEITKKSTSELVEILKNNDPMFSVRFPTIKFRISVLPNSQSNKNENNFESEYRTDLKSKSSLNMQANLDSRQSNLLNGNFVFGISQNDNVSHSQYRSHSADMNSQVFTRSPQNDNVPNNQCLSQSGNSNSQVLIESVTSTASKNSTTTKKARFLSIRRMDIETISNSIAPDSQKTEPSIEANFFNTKLDEEIPSSLNLSNIESKNETLSESKNDILSESKNDILSESKKNTLSGSKNEMLSESKNYTLSESKKNTLSESKNDTLSGSKNEMLSESKKNTLSESKNDTLSFSHSETTKHSSSPNDNHLSSMNIEFNKKHTFFLEKLNEYFSSKYDSKSSENVPFSTNVSKDFCDISLEDIIRIEMDILNFVFPNLPQPHIQNLLEQSGLSDCFKYSKLLYFDKQSVVLNESDDINLKVLDLLKKERLSDFTEVVFLKHQNDVEATIDGGQNVSEVHCKLNDLRDKIQEKRLLLSSAPNPIVQRRFQESLDVLLLEYDNLLAELQKKT